jgi:signal transduction histidine kinase/ActR/RegA family two-component response regulator
LSSSPNPEKQERLGRSHLTGSNSSSRGAIRGSFIDRYLLPAILGVLTIISALTLWQNLLRKQRADMEIATKDRTLFVRDELESSLRDRILPLELVGEHRQYLKEGDSGLKTEASLLMNRYHAYQAIASIDPTFNRRWVLPRKGSARSISSHFSSSPRMLTALRKAEESGRVVLVRSIFGQQDETGLLICVPVYREERLDSYLVGVLRYRELFDSALKDVESNYAIAIYEGDQEIYPQPPSTPPRNSAWIQETDITFRQLSWRLRVWPKPATLAYAQSPLPNITFVGGILLACLLAFAVSMAEASHLQSLQLKAANKALEREITSREQTEEALRQAQKMEAVGRLAGGIAHNFNNLLIVVRGHAGLSLNRIDSDHTLHHPLSEIVNATDKASSLTRQLLAFSRKQPLQLQVLDLNALITQMGELLPPVLGEDIRLTVALDPELGPVKTDSGQMEQVIMNLVFNARDAMPRGGNLTIRTSNTYLQEEWVDQHPGTHPGPHIELAVTDTGDGMDEETQARIFEPFFTTKDRSKGTGLGLSTVYGTVNKSGGYIVVSSKLGEGTSIKIYLPRTEEPVPVTNQQRKLAEASRGRETILVIEDDTAVRRMTREFLSIHGYTVREAGSGAEAIEFLATRSEQIDLVLTDVLMPGMKGRELGERLGQARNGIKILYMSAHTEDYVLGEDMLIPGTPFIEKPFSPDDLVAKVRETLRKSAVPTENPTIIGTRLSLEADG